MTQADLNETILGNAEVRQANSGGDLSIDLIGAWITILLWIVLFAGGALVETLPSRIAISPASSVQSIKTDTLANMYALVKESGDTEGDEKVLREKLIGWARRLNILDKTKHFMLCVFFYTPINLAILSFVSGMIGGYFSNFYVRNLKDRGFEIKEPERLRFLEEPPLTSAIRGFLAYVCFIAGVYIVMNDPFGDTSAGQYLKIAGTMTAVAFSFGYDPTKIGQLLNVIPGGNSGSTSNKPASDSAGQEHAFKNEK